MKLKQETIYHSKLKDSVIVTGKQIDVGDWAALFKLAKITKSIFQGDDFRQTYLYGPMIIPPSENEYILILPIDPDNSFDPLWTNKEAKEILDLLDE